MPTPIPHALRHPARLFGAALAVCLAAALAGCSGSVAPILGTAFAPPQTGNRPMGVPISAAEPGQPGSTLSAASMTDLEGGATNPDGSASMKAVLPVLAAGAPDQVDLWLSFHQTPPPAEARGAVTSDLKAGRVLILTDEQRTAFADALKRGREIGVEAYHFPPGTYQVPLLFPTKAVGAGKPEPIIRVLRRPTGDAPATATGPAVSLYRVRAVSTG